MNKRRAQRRIVHSNHGYQLRQKPDNAVTTNFEDGRSYYIFARDPWSWVVTRFLIALDVEQGHRLFVHQD